MDLPRDILSRRLKRERRARENAERLLEQKNLDLFLEAGERHEALDALRESEERYRLIVELSPDAILISTDGRIVFANEAAKKLFRENESLQLIGTSKMDLAPPEQRAHIADRVKILKQAGSFTHTEETKIGRAHV